MARNLDELVSSTEHAEPVHPFRDLWNNNFYLESLVSTEGGLWLLMMDALLVVPLIMAAFFYPVEVLISVAALLVVSFIGYEGFMMWRKRHLKTT